MKTFKIFVRYIKTLGWKLGWKYWKARQRCLKDPEYIKKWAINCEDEGNRLSLLGRGKEADAFFDFAKQLMLAYSASTNFKTKIVKESV